MRNRCNKKKIIKHVFILASFFGFILWIYLFLSDVDGMQRNIFFENANDWFMDFYNVVYFSVGRNPYSWGFIPARNYLPISYLILYPFSFLYPYDINDGLTAYVARYSQLSGIAVGVFLVISFGSLFYCLYKKSKGTEFEKLGVLLALFVSGVTIFSFDRANELILAVALLCVFLMTYDSKRRVLNHIGFICLAISAAMKIYPAVFGVLLLYKKRYKDAFVTILYGIMAAFLPFFWLEGGAVQNFSLFVKAMRQYTTMKVIEDLGLLAPNIISDGLKIHNMLPYFLSAAAVLLAWRLKENWKKILMISLAIIYVTSQQGFYSLLYLFYPVVLFLDSDYNWKDWLYGFGFILMLTPLQYEIHVGPLILTQPRVANTVGMVMYICLIIEAVCVSAGELKGYLRHRNQVKELEVDR